MMSRKRFLMLFSLVVFMIVLVSVFALQKNNQTTDNQTTDTSIEASGYRMVDISGLSGLGLEDTFRVQDNEQIGEIVYGFIAQQVENPEPEYTANVRDNSFKMSTVDALNTASLLVDIPALQRTVKVTFESPSDGSYNTLHVVCPDQTELVYKPVACKEVEQ